MECWESPRDLVVGVQFEKPMAAVLDVSVSSQPRAYQGRRWAGGFSPGRTGVGDQRASSVVSAVWNWDAAAWHTDADRHWSYCYQTGPSIVTLKLGWPGKYHGRR